MCQQWLVCLQVKGIDLQFFTYLPYIVLGYHVCNNLPKLRNEKTEHNTKFLLTLYFLHIVCAIICQELRTGRINQEDKILLSIQKIIFSVNTEDNFEI